jgi:beta-phosphoglucomutase-like phosphatase (HAD superfamily)
MTNKKWNGEFTPEQRERTMADLKKAAARDPADLARELDLIASLIAQERELIDGVEELLKSARFLTLEPLAAYTRLRGTEQYTYFTETYERVESWFDLAVKTRQRIKDG